jgi:hypothetical protein
MPVTSPETKQRSPLISSYLDANPRMPICSLRLLLRINCAIGKINPQTRTALFLSLLYLPLSRNRPECGSRMVLNIYCVSGHSKISTPRSRYFAYPEVSLVARFELKRQGGLGVRRVARCQQYYILYYMNNSDLGEDHSSSSGSAGRAVPQCVRNQWCGSQYS